MDERLRERPRHWGGHFCTNWGWNRRYFLEKSLQRSLEKLHKTWRLKQRKKGLKQLEKKLESLLEKKSMISFPRRPDHPKKGAEIMAILQEPTKTDKYQYVKDVYNDLL